MMMMSGVSKHLVTAFFQDRLIFVSYAPSGYTF